MGGVFALGGERIGEDGCVVAAAASARLLELV